MGDRSECSKIKGKEELVEGILKEEVKKMEEKYKRSKIVKYKTLTMDKELKKILQEIRDVTENPMMEMEKMRKENER